MCPNPIYDYVERLSELLRVDARQAGAVHGLQPVQLEALHYLSICNRFSDTPMAVTEYLGQTKGTVSQSLKVLEKKGFLTKKPDSNDKRVSHLIVTAKGKQVLEQMLPTPMFSKACSELTDSAQEQIAGALNKLLLTLLQANGLKSFGVCGSCRYNSKAEEGEFYCNLVEQPLSATDVELVCREHEVTDSS